MNRLRIRPPQGFALSLLVLGALTCACGGTGSGNSNTGPNCGSGTHVSGGVCVVNEALAVQNNGNHWYCQPQPGTVTMDHVPEVEFDGNGAAASGTGGFGVYPNMYPAYAMSWSTGGAVDSIAITTSNPFGITLYSSITLVSSTKFTAYETYSGGTVAITCTLASGIIDTYAGTARTSIASGQTFLDNYCAAFAGQALAVDPANAYWVTSDGYIRTVSLSGGAVQTIASSVGNICGLGVDANNVYWSNGNVVAVPKTGGTPTTIVTGSGNGPLVSDGSHLFWAALNALWTAPTGGGTPTQLATLPAIVGNYSHLSIDSSYVYYVAGAGGNTLMKIPKGGGAASNVATGALTGGPIAVDSTNAYYLDGTGLSKVSLAGGFPVQLVANIYQIGANPNFAIAVDATNVYYVDAGGTIYKVPISPATTPATPTRILVAPSEAGGMALTSTQVAFIASDGNVYLAGK